MTQAFALHEIGNTFESSSPSMDEFLGTVPGILFVDHVAIAVRQGELDGQVRSYQLLGFREIHREDVLGSDQVREALLQIGDGPNLIQC
jgi:methylmalonyl-CoA/ethylmalonyl-CoA epimerase